jgi:hypothetical protein
MPIVLTSQADSRAEYESVAAILDLHGNRPAGLILHAASETENGGVALVDVWESAEHLEAFEKERLFPAFKATRTMDSIGDQPRPVTRETFDYVGGINGS